VKPTGQANEAAVAHVHALIEYFFMQSAKSSFFIGAGYGFSTIAFSGGNLHEKATGGSSVALNGGFLYRISERIGLQLEYTYTDFEMEEDIDNQPTNIDSSSDSLLLGLTIHI